VIIGQKFDQPVLITKFRMSKCRKFTGEYEGFTTKISKFILFKRFQTYFSRWKHELSQKQ